MYGWTWIKSPRHCFEKFQTFRRLPVSPKSDLNNSFIQLDFIGTKQKSSWSSTTNSSAIFWRNSSFSSRDDYAFWHCSKVGECHSRNGIWNCCGIVVDTHMSKRTTRLLLCNRIENAEANWTRSDETAPQKKKRKVNIRCFRAHHVYCSTTTMWQMSARRHLPFFKSNSSYSKARKVLQKSRRSGENESALLLFIWKNKRKEFCME